MSITLKEKYFNELSNNIRDIEAKLRLFKENVEKSEEVIKNLGDDFNEKRYLRLQLKISDLRVKLNEYNVKKEEYENSK